MINVDSFLGIFKNPKEIHPDAVVTMEHTTGYPLKIVVSWLLIMVYIEPDKFKLRVEMMGTDYPYEPDTYHFDGVPKAVEFIKQRIEELKL